MLYRKSTFLRFASLLIRNFQIVSFLEHHYAFYKPEPEMTSVVRETKKFNLVAQNLSTVPVRVVRHAPVLRQYRVDVY